MDVDLYAAMRIFVRVADARSFSGTARELNIAHSTVSKGNFLANNAEAIREAVLSGVGVSAAPTWMFHSEAASGLVTTVLGDYQLERLPLNLVYPSRRLVPAKVRAVSDFLVQEFQAEPALGDNQA
jgi:DNA-binding transcriptional LysR family regulator